ncbi:MAG: hypothetical protein HRU09_05115 [Oligoflexales bacterium]|nr:hypothetical protein [Oligoflexales bacterium]
MFNHIFIFFILLSLVGASFAGINYDSRSRVTSAATINTLLAKGYTMKQAIAISKKVKKSKKKHKKKYKKNNEISFLNLKDAIAEGLKK